MADPIIKFNILWCNFYREAVFIQIYNTTIQLIYLNINPLVGAIW